MPRFNWLCLYIFVLHVKSLAMFCLYHFNNFINMDTGLALKKPQALHCEPSFLGLVTAYYNMPLCIIQSIYKSNKNINRVTYTKFAIYTWALTCENRRH